MERIKFWINTHLTWDYAGRKASEVFSWIKKQMTWKNLAIQIVDIILVVLLVLSRWIGFWPVIIYALLYLGIYVFITTRKKLKEALSSIPEKENKKNVGRKKR